MALEKSLLVLMTVLIAIHFEAGKCIESAKMFYQ